MAYKKIIKQIKFEDILSKKQVAMLAQKQMDGIINDIKKGKVITKGYAPSTKKKRAKHGLQTRFVDLTGSTPYSKKQWRMLNQFKVHVIDHRHARIELKRNDAKKLWHYIVERYGDDLAKRI